MSDARTIAEETARASYGRLIAFLSARTRDIAAAEDALGDAFTAALVHWPQKGVPDAPEAWLLTAARRKLIDNARRSATRRESEPSLLLAIEEAEAVAGEKLFADERLKLLFICAHPAIDAAIRTPLMLQTVLGLDAARIASAFLISPATMSQRLVRAKRKISASGIPFEAPSAAEFSARADAVLDAIYAAFSVGYDDNRGDEPLAAEALFLARLAAGLLPGNAEAQGLLALLLYIDARREARRRDGVYVPLDEQETMLWNQDQIDAADEALGRAAACCTPGRYQYEAAIQSAHIASRLGEEETRGAIVHLYDRLIAIAPSIGAEIGRAAALIKAGRVGDGVSALDAIDETRIASHQPYWATRARALKEVGNEEEARAAYQRAIGLSADAAAREFLRRQMTFAIR